MAYRFTAGRRKALKRASLISARKRIRGNKKRRDSIGKFRKSGLAGVKQRTKSRIRKSTKNVRKDIRKVRAQSERAKARDIRESDGSIGYKARTR